MTRIIHYSNETGDKEGVYFTQDTDMDAYDVIPPDCTLYSDTLINFNMPSGFPMESDLIKES